MFTDITLVFFTAVLAWATIKLAQDTQVLSKLTERLVKIETQRDERELQENRRKDLATGLLAAEGIQKIHNDIFAQRLNNPSDLPLTEMKDIETLHSLKRYIEDPDCRQYLDILCSTFDSVRREKSNVRINEADIASTVRNLQNRLQCFVDNSRRELSS